VLIAWFLNEIEPLYKRFLNEGNAMLLYNILFIPRGVLATHSQTHSFDDTLFYWLKFTWVPPNHVGPILIWRNGTHMNLINKKECVW